MASAGIGCPKSQANRKVGSSGFSREGIGKRIGAATADPSRRCVSMMGAVDEGAGQNGQNRKNGQDAHDAHDAQNRQNGNRKMTTIPVRLRPRP
ncbi:hypothetical protein PA598K_06832 [Paenibacillus sp. 598K]|nr:hypothetical protein PA598K_06832 [Paenibacillus sp. 598K]